MAEEETEVSVQDLDDARRVIRDSQTSADRLIRASRELEHIVYGVSSGDSSLESTEYEIIEARLNLEQHKLSRAKKAVKKAEKNLARVEEDVIELRRNIAMLNRLLINCFIVLGIWSLATSARNPNLPVFTPIIGISESLIRVVASRIVPSPPTLMNKSIFFLSSSCELYVPKNRFRCIC